MSDDLFENLPFEIPTSRDGGLRISETTIDGEPAIMLEIIIGGLAHRIRLDPNQALAIACLIGGVAEVLGKQQNAERRAPGIRVAPTNPETVH